MRWMRAALPMLVLLAVLQPPAMAQVVRRQAPPDWRTTGSVGFGYVGNLPRALLGGNAFLIRPVLGGLGLYADFKVTSSKYSDSELMVSGRTRKQADASTDFWEADHETWRVFNLAVVHPISPELALYLGGGYARETAYADYWNEGLEYGAETNGHYRIKDEINSGTHANVLGGAMFRIGRRVTLHFGGETAPAGFDVGASLILPLR